MAYLPGFKIETKVKGVAFEDRQDVVARLTAGESVLLKREPANPYDPNAIRVECENGEQIGYIGKHIAVDLAPEFDNNGDSVPATITEIIGGYNEFANLGVKLEFVVPEPNEAGSEVVVPAKQSSKTKPPITQNEKRDFLKQSESGEENIERISTRDYPYYRYTFEYFNPVQSMVYPKKDCPNNMIIGANTSAGKTIAAELLIDSTLKKNERAIYLSPLKSLTREKYEEWQERYPGENITIMTGDYVLDPATTKALWASRIIVMTSEMLDSRTRKFRSERNLWMNQVGLVVVDESHILTTDRGDAVETGIMRFTYHNRKARIVFLSATMPNLRDLADWLTSLNAKKTDIIQSNYRPVELQKHFVEYLNAKNGKGKFDYWETEHNKMQIVIDQVQSKPNEKFLVFVHSKKVGRRLLKQLKERDVDAYFHSADLSLNQRRRIENSFKDREKGVRVLVSTSTTAWGVNLPARNVVIVGTRRGMSEVDELDIIQMAGRAGRYKIDDEGHVYLILPAGYAGHWEYVFDHPRPVTSVLNDRKKLAFHVLAEICRKTIESEADLYKWYQRSLSYRQGRRPFSKNQAGAVLKYLRDTNMIYENDTRLHPSKLGLISALMYYRPLDVYAWYRNFNTVFGNDLESDAAILAWALGSIPSYESYLPKELAYLEGDWIYKLEGLGNRLRSDTVIGMEAVYNCLEGLEGSGEVGTKMREIRYDGQRILNTLQMIDEKYAKWNKAQVWEELGNKIIQLN